MAAKDEATRFSQEEYGHAKLGHKATNNALVRVGELYARQPGSKVTDVCHTSADRQAVYKFIENEKVSVKAIREASAVAAFKRKKENEPYLLVPFDATSLKIVDESGKKGFGFIGTRKQGTSGVQVLNAILLGTDGTPLGVLGQRYWSRKESVQGTRKEQKQRPVEEKETHHWLKLMDEVEEIAEREVPGVPLWFQEDRGFDAWSVLKRLQNTSHIYTIRNVLNRMIVDGEHGGRLHVALDNAPIHYRESRSVPASKGSGSRIADLVIRATSVTLILIDPHIYTGRATRAFTQENIEGVYRVPVNAVWVHEEPKTVEGDKPLDWVLLTNWNVDSEMEAKRVVTNYLYRWRIEEFHRLWKTGAMRVEETQVRDFEHLEIVASITAAVACYLFRITHFARSNPKQPARHLLESAELKALECLHPKATQSMSIEHAVLCIAELGGYTGIKNSKGPPGPLVLARGYQKLKVGADTINGLFQKRDQW